MNTSAYYKGQWFRTEREARWAIFLDELKLMWEYEKRKVYLKSGVAVPSFFIKKVRGGMWLEVTENQPEPWQMQFAAELAKQTHYEVFLVGEPKPPRTNAEWWGNAYVVFPKAGAYDTEYWWCQCPHCKEIGLEHQGDATRFCKRASRTPGKYDESPLLMRAYQRAQTLLLSESEGKEAK